MKKFGRGGLLFTTCLSGVALAWASGAQAQDGEATWKPRAEIDARAADGSSQVSLELFAPVAQNDTNLLFVTGRIGTDERYERNGSVTLGGRGKIGEDVAIGVNAGVDFYKSDLSSRDQAAVSFGLEGFTSIFDVRLNYRLPVSNRRTIGQIDPAVSGVSVLSIENNRLVERMTGFRLEEVPLVGVNGEIGARLPLVQNLSVRASAAAFDYRDDAASRSYHGYRGGLELDVVSPVGTGGRFSLGAELQDDNRWGTQARGTVRLSVPFGRGSRDRSMGNSGLDRQMGERIRRDFVAPSGTRYTDLTSTGLAIDARTGQAFGGIYYANGAASAAGAGTSANPTTLGDAVTRAGANGVVVALGDAGAISTGGVTLAANQYLVGGASSVEVRRANGSVTGFSFGGTNGTIAGTGAGTAAISLGQGSVVRDVTVRGSGSGISANGVGGFSLDRVVIENTGGAGLTLANTTGAVVIDGITIRGAVSTGVVVSGGSNVTLRNSVVGGGAGAIAIDDSGANLTAALSNLTLSATGGTVLDIDGSGAGTVTVTDLSGLTIAGGNGETGGFAARNVTFDAAATAGIQTVNAGRMQVGTTAARIGGAGVSLTEVDGALTFADLDIANSGGTGLTVDNTKSGTFTLTTLDGTVDTVGGIALDLDPLLIDLTFASVSSTGSTGAGVILDNVQGAGTGGRALQIGTLNITDSALQGLLITGGSTGLVMIGGGSIANSGGAAVQIGEAGVAGSGGTIGLAYGGTISDASAGPLVSLFNLGGTISFTGAISGAGPITIADTLAGSGVTFAGSTAITGASSPALSLDNLAGSTSFSGPLTIANPAGTGIAIGNVPGGVTFGDVDITGLGAATGLDLTATQGNVTFGTLNISGTDAAGSTGIDLTGTTNTGAVTIINSSVIQGVDIGVDLTGANMSGSFRFGDANAANGLGSRITANTVLVVAGMNANQGTYNIADAQLDGDTNNITGGSFTSYYVLAGASGTGTATDPGSIAGAVASGAQYIVLLNDPTGGQDVIDTDGLAGGSLSLISGQSLVSFLYTDFFAVTGATVPSNLIVSNLGPTGIANTYAGSGAAILTSSTGASTVNLANDTRVDGVIIDNSAPGVGIAGSGVSNVIIRNSDVSGSAGAISITDNGAASSVTLTNLNLSSTGGVTLLLDGSGTGTVNASGTDVNIAATGAAQGLVVNDVTVGMIDFGSVSTGTASGSAAVQITQVAGGTLNIDSVTVGGTVTGVGLNVVNNSATVNVGAVTTSNTASHGVVVSGNSDNVTLGPVSVSNSGGAGILIGAGNTGAITFGDVDIIGLGANRTGLDVRNASGNMTFATLDITGASAVGTRGIDMTGATFAGTLTISGSSTITGVNTGVDLTNAAITGNFRFGDGVNTDANGAGSTISATTPLVITGLNTLSGTYDFADVNMIGDTSALATTATTYWVLAGASGAGTRSDPGSLSGAAASGADIIFLLNDPLGGTDTIDANDPTYGTGGTFSLASGQDLLGFLNGDVIALPGGAPSNISLYNITTGSVSNPFAGSGGPILTTSAAGSNLITLGATGNHLSGFILDGGGGVSRGIKDNGVGATNTLLDYLIVRNFGTMGIEITPSTSTTIDHVSFSGNPGGDVLLNAANSVLTNIVSNGGGITLNNATGTTTLIDVNLAGGAGLIFTNAGGTINATNVDITNPLVAGLTISGGTAAFNFDLTSSLAKSSAGASLTIGGGHNTGIFTYAGTLNITGGTGLQFNNADGTYNFTGTTTLAGGDAGIDILNGSGGTFSFGSGTSITSPMGAALNVSGSTAAITYSGSISQANNAALVSILNHSGGTITFQSGTLSATNGTGLQFDNADGTYAFEGTTTLNGGDAGIDVVNGSDGNFGFSSGATITHAAAGDAFVLTDSNASLNYLGSIDDSNGYAVRIDNHDAGTVTFLGGTINSSGANARGLSVSNSNGGSINFNGQTTLSTQANNAVSLTSNAGATIQFNGGVFNLNITTTSGTAFTVANGGTINVLGFGNIITTGSGTLLDISNAAAVTSVLNLNFAAASNTLGANGILVSRTAGTLAGSANISSGAITATSRGVDVDGGALSLTYNGSVATSGTTARSAEVTNMTGGTVTLNGNLIDNALGINVANNSGGSVNFYGQTVALNTVANVNAVTLANNTGTFITFSSAAGGNGIDIVASGTGNGIDFTGGGTLTVYSTGNSIQTGTGQILNMVNGNVSSLGLVFDSLISTGSTNGSAININNIDGGTLNASTVSIAGTIGATADGIFYGGGSTMNVNLGAVSIANTGDEGIEINGTGNGTFTAASVTINNTGGNGVEINNSGNSVSLNGGAIGATNDPTGFGVYVLNGTGAVTVASSITKTTGNSVVFVDNHETGNVTFSGAISATGGLNNGIVVQNVNSGTISFTGNKTLTTGANTAVTLLNNTGGTISFPNGNMVINTTSGTGFTATGGGAVTVEGTGNTITSTTGTALNVVNTTIGTNGLRFQSISSNGAASGIVLNNTGSSGGINVTGTGAAGSGGTIQNSSGDGISLTSTENVRLAYMNVINNLGDGIGGSNINGFLIDNMTISGNGDDAGTDESGINIANLSGTASAGARPTGIFNSTIQNNNEFEVQITNTSGTLTNFQVVNSIFASNGQPINGNGSSPHGNLINFLGTGTSQMGISVYNSSFTGNWNAASPPATTVGSGLFIDSSGTSMTAQVSGSTFTNTNNGVNVSTGPGSTTMTYSIDSNTFTGTRSTAINDFQNGNAPFTRTVNGRITNNIIGNNSVLNSGSNSGNGISIGNEGAVNANYLISGNTIQQIETTTGITVNVGLLGLPTGNGTTNVTILNNTIRNINGSRAILINNGQNTGGFPTVNVSLSGNNFSGIYGQSGNGQYLRFSASGGGTINITQGQATVGAIASEIDDANGFNDTTKISLGGGALNWGQPAPTLPPASVPLP